MLEMILVDPAVKALQGRLARLAMGTPPTLRYSRGVTALPLT